MIALEISTATASAERYTLERFARHAFYEEVNRELVRRSGVRAGQHVVDLGAGTGAVTRLLVERLGRRAGLHAVEPNRDQIEAARRGLQDIRHSVRWLRGGVDVLLDQPRRSDAVFFCNAIHLVTEKDRMLRDIARCLRVGGTLALNTSFFDGAEPEEAAPFYRRWMIKSLRVLRARHGLSPSHDRTEARRRLTPTEYVALLENCGFEVQSQEVLTVQMPLAGFEDISRYSLWIEGVLPGVPLDAGSDALIEGARQAFQELGLETSPRSWLLIVARKRGVGRLRSA